MCVFGQKIQGAGGYSIKPADGAACAGLFALVIIILIRIINISDGGRGGVLMQATLLMHCDNACPLCPALDPIGSDRLDSAVRVKGRENHGCQCSMWPGLAWQLTARRIMLNTPFIPFMSTNE